MNSLVDIIHLKKTYQTEKEEIQAVDDFSYSVKEKEFISIIGPSGSGKSTILSILAKIEDSEGKIIHKDITFGYMLQNDCLLEFRNILDNCLLGLEIKHKLNKENIDYVISLLEKYGLKDFMYLHPSNLSGGMRQRVALIRTLALKPDILLLDEPFSSLDYQTRLHVENDILEIVKREKVSVIMVTHNLEEALTMSDTVITLSKRPSKIKNIYKMPFDKSLNILEKKEEKQYHILYKKLWEDLNQNE